MRKTVNAIDNEIISEEYERTFLKQQKKRSKGLKKDLRFIASNSELYMSYNKFLLKHITDTIKKNGYNREATHERIVKRIRQNRIYSFNNSLAKIRGRRILVEKFSDEKSKEELFLNLFSNVRIVKRKSYSYADIQFYYKNKEVLCFALGSNDFDWIDEYDYLFSRFRFYGDANYYREDEERFEYFMEEMMLKYLPV